MKIYGIMMVRNEADIVAINVRYHLAMGVDRMLIMDNNSSDDTRRVLQDLARDARVRWTRYNGAYEQAELTTELAREAFCWGADWIMPIDADEFWMATQGDFRRVLAETSASALEVQVVNFVQRREQLTATPDALLHMTRRPPAPVGLSTQAAELVEGKQIGFVEMRYVPKWISRASATLTIAKGNHAVDGIVGKREATDAIVCLHAPLRSQSILAAKVAQRHFVRSPDQYVDESWHMRRWRRIAEEGGLDQEWLANSYANAHLDVYGSQRSLVFDARLRHAVQPFVTIALNEANPAVSSDTPSDTPVAPNGRFVLDTFLMARMDAIEGWLRPSEGELLIDLARRAILELGPQPIVEVGSYCGKSTVGLAAVVQTLCPEGRVYAIDPHEGKVGAMEIGIRMTAPTLQKFEHTMTMMGLTDTVEVIVKHSYDVEWDQPIGLLFIDGLHDYPNVSRDFAHFEAYVVPGGYVAFHDCEPTFPGIVAFVGEVLNSGRYREVERAESIVVVQKLPQEVGATPASSPAGQVESISPVSAEEGQIITQRIRVLTEDGLVAQRRIRSLTEEQKAAQAHIHTLTAQADTWRRHEVTQAEAATRVAEVQTLLGQAQATLTQQAAELQRLREHNAQLHQFATDEGNELRWMKASKGWKAISAYYSLRRKLMGIGSRKSIQ